MLVPDAPTVPPIASALWHGSGGDGPQVGDRWVCVATPVHLTAGMSRVTLAGDGVLTLTPSEAQALAADFNQVFAGAESRLVVARAAVLLCVLPPSQDIATHEPACVAGHDVFAFQPSGPDAPRLRRLMSEMEMWLFDHAVNRERAAAARPTVTGLWLWGGGSTSDAPPAVRGWTAGQDPLFAAFGDEPELPGGTESGVVVCSAPPGSSDWPEVERRWLAPAAAALDAGRIERLELSAAGHRVSVAGGPNFRFWRRPRPWWEAFELSEQNGIQ